MHYQKNKICNYLPSLSDACPLWMRGNSTIVRVEDNVFATFMHPVEGRVGYNSLILELYAKRGDGDWQLEYSDAGVLQSNPSPILHLGNHLIGVSVSAGDETDPPNPKECGIRCTPMFYVFDISGPAKLVRRVTLRWDDPKYFFSEHDYRSSVLDTVRGDILFTNMYNDGVGAFCFTLLDKKYRTVRCGKLNFPERCCFHTMYLKDGECYIFAVRDVIEPVKEWKAYKKETTGNVWDYAIRWVYMSYCPDIRTAEFTEPVLVADQAQTEGFVGALDCAADGNGDLLFVYGTINIRTACMRDRFFPDKKFERTLEVVRVQGTEVVDRYVIDRSIEMTKESGEDQKKRPDGDFGPGLHCWADADNPRTGYGAGFHTRADGTVCLLWAKDHGPITDEVDDGIYLYHIDTGVSECIADKDQPQCILDNTNLGTFYNSRTRLGAVPSDIADLYCIHDEAVMMHLEIGLS